MICDHQDNGPDLQMDISMVPHKWYDLWLSREWTDLQMDNIMVPHKRYDLWLKRMDLTCKWDIMVLHKLYDTDGLAQDCRNSSALAMELQQTYAKPSVCNQQQNGSDLQWPLLLTWFNFNPSMDM